MNNTWLQPLWYNRELKIGFKSVYNQNLLSIGMWCVGDLFTDGNIIPFDVWLNQGARKNGIFKKFVMISHLMPWHLLVV